ncbi:hypothetical protein [Parageobacillus thermoglucosidasius]|uniref:DUF3992 domain-containing protein n=2 Tax=Anoxybacillaceae TaxID=3120669 RepID=A0AAN1D704_PARTM|nr:hypothetical protein [Parageobacillus thermoglucosidasius]KYD17299.1 hypothetical protein B4168_1699 [Anoxybacillus flavithermus]REK53982.1 MAG: hypothetical protein C6P36_15280 [Geobacillus sp.]AEH48286.1 hypothetical protein Geoth_2362 [Parageobacillus thermoglucosidasius C56-YS93]ALF10490.1 hypothetical protein AOT13_10960 [Parageobacillus thermoglucosidasius]ANZ30570.1 hypothetical protein BCV53_10975 [Parageobacillus thermoglucosidasius]
MAINLEHFDQKYSPECIQVCKVYDWTTNVVSLTQDLTFTFPTGSLTGVTISQVNCSVSLLECVEDGPRRDIECMVGDQPVTLQAVTLSKTIQVILEVIGTNTEGAQVTVLSTPVMITTSEEVILCAPEGTTVCCNSTQNDFNVCRVGAFTQNGDTITATILLRICQSIVVTFEVILEVAARFCQPRPEIICEEECPVDVFPPQCPSIFPV